MQRAFARCLHSKEISNIAEKQQVFIVKKCLPVVLYYHMRSNNFLLRCFEIIRIT